MIPATVAKKLLAVMSEVSYIKKDKKNAFHGYSYASEAAIKDALHGLLVKHGLLFVPMGCDIISEVEMETAGKDGRAKKERLMTVRYAYRFVDAETGDSFEGYSLGTGIDTGDKSVYKAITGALKYILTTTFLIPTGDDPESEHESRQSKKEAAKAVGEQKLAQMQEAKATQPIFDQQFSKDIKRVQPATTKNFEALEAFAAIKKVIGEKMYYAVLTLNGFQKSNQITDTKQAREVYKQMGEIKKAFDAGAHGELLSSVTQPVFEAMPETSRGAIISTLRSNLGKALGSVENAVDEYDSLRAKSITQWELAKALESNIERYQVPA